MIWLVARRYRGQIIATTALAVAIILALGAHGVATLRAVQTIVCPPDMPACAERGAELAGRYYQVSPLLGWLVLMPVVIGAFWGAPLVAREFRSSTVALAWTQSITRRRWLAAHLAVLCPIVMGLGLAVGVSVEWWFDVFADIQQPGALTERSLPGMRGLLPAAWWLTAFAVGVLAGTVLRSTLPAMAVTGLITLFVIYALSTFVNPATVGDPVRAEVPHELPLPDGVLILQTDWSVSDGASGTTGTAPEPCLGTLLQNRYIDCMVTAGHHGVVTYAQPTPASRIQAIHLGILLTISTLALAGTTWQIQRVRL